MVILIKIVTSIILMTTINYPCNFNTSFVTTCLHMNRNKVLALVPSKLLGAKNGLMYFSSNLANDALYKIIIK